MNNKNTIITLKTLIQTLGRYKTAILLKDPPTIETNQIQDLASTLSCHYLNLTTELLPQTISTNFSPTLGAYSFDDLLAWLLNKAKQPIMVDNIEALVATFGPNKAIRFFQHLTRSEPKAAIIIVTYLQHQIEAANFPTNRILNLTANRSATDVTSNY